MRSVLAAAVLTAGLTASGFAQVNGTVYTGLTCLDSTCDASNVASSITGSTPSAQFTVNGINFNSYTTGYDIDTFLNIPDASFFNATNGFDPTGTSDDTYYVFTGSIYLNQGVNNFTIEHDDGLTLSLDQGIGEVVDDPGATAAVNTPFTITASTAGIYNYTLDYDECCGPPAVLNWSYPDSTPVGSTPEPATFALFGGGLVLLGAARRRLF